MSFDGGGSIISMGVSALGLGMSTYADYKQVQAENAAKEWNSFVSVQQARLADAKADVYTKLGKQEKAETILEYDALASKQRADFAAGGVNVNVGTAIKTQANTKMMGVYEGQKAQYQRDLQAWEMRNEANSLRINAELDLASQRNPWLSAGTTAIGGLTNIYSQYGQWQRQTS